MPASLADEHAPECWFAICACMEAHVVDDVMQDETLGESLGMCARCPNKNDDFKVGLRIPCNQACVTCVQRRTLRMTNMRERAVQQLL